MSQRMSQRIDDRELEARLRAFAGGAPPVDSEVVWRRVQSRLATPAPVPAAGPTRRDTRRDAMRRPLRAVAALAAAVAILTIAAAGLLLTGRGTADASFLAAVDGLTQATEAALDDGRISADEAAGLKQRIDRVQAALADDESIQSIAPARLTAALNALAAVQDRLGNSDRPELATALTTLGEVRNQVIERHEAVPSPQERPPEPPPRGPAIDGELPPQAEGAPGPPETPGDRRPDGSAGRAAAPK